MYLYFLRDHFRSVVPHFEATRRCHESSLMAIMCFISSIATDRRNKATFSTAPLIRDRQRRSSIFAQFSKDRFRQVTSLLNNWIHKIIKISRTKPTILHTCKRFKCLRIFLSNWTEQTSHLIWIFWDDWTARGPPENSEENLSEKSEQVWIR